MFSIVGFFECLKTTYACLIGENRSETTEYTKLFTEITEKSLRSLCCFLPVLCGLISVQ